MNALPLFAYALPAIAGLVLVMSGAWLVQRTTRNTGWIDVFWSYGTGLTGVVLALVPYPDNVPSLRQLLVAGFAGFWSLRLGSHILGRTRNTGDDPRYRALLDAWGRTGQLRLFGQLLVQALVGSLLALSLMVAARAPEPLFRAQDILAVAILAVSVAGEAIADRQVRNFARVHRGGVCDVGLWRWSRHPNYFFEWLFWLAVPLLAIAPSYPQGLIALAAPAVMYWLLVHVSGIPPLEQHMLATRGQKFRDYVQRTSAFIPLPPRRLNRTAR